jgi:hypothetical protein
MNFTHEHAAHLIKKTKSLSQRLENMKEKFSGVTAKVIQTAEIGLGALAGGVIQGKAGPEGATFVHVPIDLGAGLVLNALSVFEVAGAHSAHLGNVGDGLIASYVTTMGFNFGKSWHDTGKLFGHKDQGSLPPATKASGTLDPSQMADILARVQRAGVPG